MALTKEQLDAAYEIYLYYSGFFSTDRQETMEALFALGYASL